MCQLNVFHAPSCPRVRSCAYLWQSRGFFVSWWRPDGKQASISPIRCPAAFFGAGPVNLGPPGGVGERDPVFFPCLTLRLPAAFVFGMMDTQQQLSFG